MALNVSWVFTFLQAWSLCYWLFTSKSLGKETVAKLDVKFIKMSYAQLKTLHTIHKTCTSIIPILFDSVLFRIHVGYVVSSHQTCKNSHNHLGLHLCDILRKGIDSSTNLPCHWYGIFGICNVVLQCCQKLVLCPINENNIPYL